MNVPCRREPIDGLRRFTGRSSVGMTRAVAVLGAMMQFCTQTLDGLAKHHAPSLIFANTRRTAPLIKQEIYI